MPRKSPFAMRFTEQERAELEARGQEYTSPYRDVVRAKIVPLANQGLGNDLTIDIDLTGVFRTMRVVVPGMRRRGSGGVIALSSIMGVACGWNEHIHYSAAKTGIVGLVRGLAVELARDGIRVNGIAPGYIRTAQALSVMHSFGPAGLDVAARFIPCLSG